MKIQLPDGKRIKLEDNISLEEKKKVVKQLVDEWRDIVKTDKKTWFSNAVKYFLDALANYLLWHKEKEQKWTEDKEVLSITKIEQMTGKRKSKTVCFSNLSQDKKESLGIED